MGIASQYNGEVVKYCNSAEDGQLPLNDKNTKLTVQSRTTAKESFSSTPAGKVKVQHTSIRGEVP